MKTSGRNFNNFLCVGLVRESGGSGVDGVKSFLVLLVLEELSAIIFWRNGAEPGIRSLRRPRNKCSPPPLPAHLNRF